MRAIIEHVGADLLCWSEGRAPSGFRLDGNRALETLECWATRYDTAVRRGKDGELLAIGRELFVWLDESGWASTWAKAIGSRSLEVRVDDLSEPLARAILDAPWELLAREDGHLVDDAV